MPDQPPLTDYFRAGYPLIHVETTEYERALLYIIDSFSQVSQDSGQRLAVWKNGVGLTISVDFDIDKQTKTSSSTSDLSEALRWLKAEADRDAPPILMIVMNLEDNIQAPGVVQAMVDASLAARSALFAIVILGPGFSYPPAIAGMVARLLFALPNEEDLLALFRNIARRYVEFICDGTIPWATPTGQSNCLVEYEFTEEQEALLSAAARSALGLNSLAAENAFCLSIVSKRAIDLGLIQQQKKQEVQRSDVIEFVTDCPGMADVGGMDLLKRWLLRRQVAFSPEARAYGLPYPKGILVVGPGGTGKSLVAKATASLMNLPLLRMDLGRIFRSLVGESEAAIRSALGVAEAISPCVLWIDEIDKGFSGLASSGMLDSGVTSRVISTLLSWRAETTRPVMLVATANEIGSLPSMVYRQGRFDAVWWVDLPKAAERREILEIHLRKRGRKPDVFDLDCLVEEAEDCTGAEIESSIEDAMFFAFSEGRELTTADIHESISATAHQQAGNRAEIQTQRLKNQSRRLARPVSS
jgi:AAA+ superfamily predicted ATPase